MTSPTAALAALPGYVQNALAAIEPHHADTLREYITALAALPASGDWVLVPKQATREMLNAGEETFVPTYTGTPISSPSAVWDAMLTAAPTPGEPT